MPSFEVLLNNADVTSWCRSIRVEQPADTIYRRFQLELVGAHEIPNDARWDIYWSQTGAPRETLLIRQGVLAPGWRDTVRFGRDRSGEAIAPIVRVEGYDSVYLATRRSPRDTIVLASTRAKADAAVRSSRSVLGRWRWVEVRTLHDAIRWLAGQASSSVGNAVVQFGGASRSMSRRDDEVVAGLLRGGATKTGAASAAEVGSRVTDRRASLGVQISLPNHAFSAKVLAPTGAGHAPAATSSSYWSHLTGLIRPWNAEVLYRRESNTLLISDRLTDALSPPSVVPALSQGQIARITGWPMRRRNVRRVVGRIS